MTPHHKTILNKSALLVTAKALDEVLEKKGVLISLHTRQEKVDDTPYKKYFCTFQYITND